THASRWTNSPNANYTIAGLTPETHAAYCRDALSVLLKACPAIAGVTLRVHGESGVAEGSYDFWKAVFDGVTRCGRKVEIDLHAKGIDQPTIDAALATGLPVTISPKFWAEHLGLPYHQAAIRPQEMPPRDRKDQGFFALSSGSRRFLRYGYGDLLAEGRRPQRAEFGAGAVAAEAALAHASRILPLVTTAHLPSAANNYYWPEVYTSMSVVDPAVPHPYSDTPSPKRFGTVSPLDPALFSR